MSDLTTNGAAGGGGEAADLSNRPRAADDRVLLLLAVDHRNSLERDLYGLKGAISPTQAARISADKLLVCQALLDALPGLPEGVQPGILVDEQYGASVAELTARSAGAVSLAMPIEKSGENWLRIRLRRRMD